MNDIIDEEGQKLFDGIANEGRQRIKASGATSVKVQRDGRAYTVTTEYPTGRRFIGKKGEPFILEDHWKESDSKTTSNVLFDSIGQALITPHPEDEPKRNKKDNSQLVGKYTGRERRKLRANNHAEIKIYLPADIPLESKPARIFWKYIMDAIGGADPDLFGDRDIIIDLHRLVERGTCKTIQAARVLWERARPELEELKINLKLATEGNWRGDIRVFQGFPEHVKNGQIVTHLTKFDFFEYAWNSYYHTPDYWYLPTTPDLAGLLGDLLHRTACVERRLSVSRTYATLIDLLPLPKDTKHKKQQIRTPFLAALKWLTANDPNLALNWTEGASLSWTEWGRQVLHWRITGGANYELIPSKKEKAQAAIERKQKAKESAEAKKRAKQEGKK